MTVAETPAGLLSPEAARPAPSFRLLRRLLRRPVAVAALCVIVVVYGAGVLAPWIAPYDFNYADFDSLFAGPSSEHLLGTDRLGRDVLSRLIWSAQTTVIVSVATVFMGGLILGVTLGLVAGYAGGAVDNIIMRIGDAVASVPTILLLLIINMTLAEPFQDLFRDIEDLTGIHGMVRAGIDDYFLVFGALSLFSWVGMARLVRSQVLALRETDYVFAARAMGGSTPRILLRHLLPNISNLLIVAATLTLGSVAAAEVALSFLGIGVHSPHASFGVMIADYAGVSNIRNHFTLVLYPAVVVSALMLAFNLLGDVLTDVTSPRRR